MAKFSYSKLEQIIIGILRKYRRKVVWEDIIRILEERKLNARKKMQRRPPSEAAATKLMDAIVFNLKLIKEHSPESFEELYKIRKRCKELSHKLDSLTVEEWDELRTSKKHLSTVRAHAMTRGDGDYTDEVVEEAKRALKKKGKYQFNVADSWETV